MTANHIFFYKGKTEHEAYTEYFESVLDNLHSGADFDVYGHIDYVVRYGPDKNKYYSYEKYADIIDAILKCRVVWVNAVYYMA